MKRILFIAPHSFPIKSSESICNSKVAYILAKAGYQVDVYTCSESSTYPYDVVLDKQLRDSENLKIITIKMDYLLRRKESISNIIRAAWFNFKVLIRTGYYYNGISVPYLILSEIKKNIRKEGGFFYDAVITRGFFTDLVGVWLSKRYGVKWIANWNDPYPSVKFPAPYGKGYDAKLPYFENKIYKDIQRYATIHTFPNPRLRDYMLKCFTRVDKSNTVVIPHMALSKLSPVAKVKTDRLTFVHCGDAKKPRNPELLLRAIANVSSLKEISTIPFHFYFVGAVDVNIRELIGELNIDKFITILPSKPYKEAVEFIVIEAQCEEGIYLPTKVVDSLQCGVPIFCISPNVGYLHDITSKYNIGYFAKNDSLEEITTQFRRILLAYREGTLPQITPNVIPEFFEQNISQIYKNILA